MELNEAGSSAGAEPFMSQFGGQLGTLGQQATPMMKDTTSSERRHNLEMLDASFHNILTKQD